MFDTEIENPVAQIESGVVSLGGATVNLFENKGNRNSSKNNVCGDCDKISINIFGAIVSFKNYKLTFSVGDASLMLNFTGISADLINDDNFIGESSDLSDITPITYEQGDYQNIYESGNTQDTLSGTGLNFPNAVPLTFRGCL